MSLPTIESLIEYADQCTPAQVLAALTGVLRRIDVEARAVTDPVKNPSGLPGVPVGMLRVYVQDEVACILGVPDHSCVLHLDGHVQLPLFEP